MALHDAGYADAARTAAFTIELGSWNCHATGMAHTAHLPHHPVVPFGRRAVRLPVASRPTRSADAPDCHSGRLITNPIAREMAIALGVVVCRECHRTLALKGRQGTVLRPVGAGWREN